MARVNEDSNWRRAERFNAAARITVTAGKDKFSGIMRDISLKGISFRSEDLIETEETCLFEIALPDGPVVKTKGIFMWKRPLGREHLYGVDFTRIGFFANRRLKKWLAHRAEIFKGKVWKPN